MSLTKLMQLFLTDRSFSIRVVALRFSIQAVGWAYPRDQLIATAVRPLYNRPPYGQTGPRIVVC